MNTAYIAETKDYLNLKVNKLTDGTIVNGHINSILYMIYSDIERLGNYILIAVIEGEARVIFEATGNYISMPITIYKIYIHKIELSIDKNKKETALVRAVCLPHGIVQLEFEADGNIKIKETKKENTFKHLKIFQAMLIMSYAILAIIKIVQVISRYAG